jgi:hypothetical protein
MKRGVWGHRGKGIRAAFLLPQYPFIPYDPFKL